MEILKRRIVADSTETDIVNGVEVGSAAAGMGELGGIELDIVPNASRDALDAVVSGV